MPFGVKPKNQFDRLIEGLTKNSDWRVPMALPAGSPMSDMMSQFFPEQQDAMMLAKTALGEARGEGSEGMRAVMHTVVNRQAAVPGASISDIVLAPMQFSAWNAGNPNREYMEQVNLDENEHLIDMAEKVISRGDVDPTGGATHYYAPGEVDEMPGWAGKMEKTATVGGHTFFKEKKKRRRM